MIERDATPFDAHRIASLERELFGSTAWTEDLVRGELEGPYRVYRVYEENNDIIGYGGVLVIGDDADIQTIALTEDSRGKGLGKKLLNSLLLTAITRGAKQVFLEVRADSSAALHLYESAGFQQIGRREAYYQPEGVDAIIMQLCLDPYVKGHQK